MDGIAVNIGFNGYRGFYRLGTPVETKLTDVIDEIRRLLCMYAGWNQRTEQHADDGAQAKKLLVFNHRGVN